MPVTTFAPDKYQTEILKVFTQTQHNIFIDAKAGSGKTTTLLYLMEHIPPETKAVSMAFSKNIQLELASKIPKHIESMTLHSYGNQILRKAKIIKETNKWKVGEIVSKLLKGRSGEFKEAVVKIVSLYKNTLEKDLNVLLEKYQVDLADGSLAELEYFIPQIIERDKKLSLEKGECDFDDMLWLPIELKLATPKYDDVLIDETQDLNTAQIELVMRAVSGGGRVVGVGDRNQSVFQFRGANPASIELLIQRLKDTPRSCVPLPLSISYRCSTEVIKLAKTIVPDIEAAPNAVKGSTGSKTKAELEEFFKKITPEMLKDDASRKVMILCRVNAPLIEWQMFLKKLKLPYVFRSTMLASQLQELIAKNSSYGTASLHQTCLNLQESVKKAKKYMRGMVLAAYADKISTLLGFINAAPPSDNLKDSYRHIDSAIEALFKPSPDSKDVDKDAVLISTIHGAKGLEAKHVFVIRPDLMPHPLAKKEFELVQESNLQYVAITRAKANLCYISNPEEETESKK